MALLRAAEKGVKTVDLMAVWKAEMKVDGTACTKEKL